MHRGCIGDAVRSSDPIYSGPIQEASMTLRGVQQQIMGGPRRFCLDLASIRVDLASTSGGEYRIAMPARWQAPTSCHRAGGTYQIPMA
eukprot:2381687-Pyramimonas_sp.AAC.1